MMTMNGNQLCDGEGNDENHNSSLNQGISNYNNNHHHHQRGRKDDPTSFIELPYKKQTVKEVASKKSSYHYSIL